MRTILSYRLLLNPALLKKSTIVIVILFLLSSSCFSQEVLKAELSESECPNLPGNVKLSYDFEDCVIMFKVDSDKAFLYRFDKESKLISEKLAVSKKDMVWIEGFERDNLLYCFYYKQVNKLSRILRVYLDIIDLRSTEFIEQQKFLFETKPNIASIEIDFRSYLGKLFYTSMSDNKEYLIFEYCSQYSGPSKENQTIYNVFCFNDRKVIREKILINTLDEPIIQTEIKAGNNGEFIYLGRTGKSKRRILEILTEDESEIVNVPLSENLNNIDTIQFFKNEFNGNLMIGGININDQDEQKPYAFVIEIDYNGKLIREINYALDNVNFENIKSLKFLKLLTIFHEKSDSYFFTLLNLKTNEIYYDIVNFNGTIQQSSKNTLFPLSYRTPTFVQPPCFRIIESSYFKDLFYFSINPKTRKENLYLKRYSKTQNTSVDYIILENEKIINPNLDDFILSGILPSIENNYYFEKNIDRTKNILIKVNLK